MGIRYYSTLCAMQLSSLTHYCSFFLENSCCATPQRVLLLLSSGSRKSSLLKSTEKKNNNTNGHCKNAKEKNSSDSESTVYERHYQQHCIQVCNHLKSHKNTLMFQCNQHLMSQTTLHISKEKGCRYIYAEQTHKPGQ